MEYFKKRENVQKYKEMVGEHDGSWLIEKLSVYLNNGNTVLELGMGLGLDFELLSKKYAVTGTDNSPIFVEDYKNKNPKADIVLLDAIHVDINKNFDCIFSNKVLHHLTKKQFEVSLKNQKAHLNDDGIIFMTLWHGEHKEEMMFNDELRFTYYKENDIKEIVGDDFEILAIEKFKEFDEDDSILVVLKNVER